MFIKTIFWNIEELRVRAGWRILIQLLSMSFLIMGLMFIVNEFKNFLPGTPAWAASSLFQKPIEVFSFLLTAFLCAKYLDKRSFKDFGLVIDKKWRMDFYAGLSLGIILMTLIFGIEYSAGWITITEQSQFVGTDFIYGILYGVVLFLLVGFQEEMLVRGYMFKNISEGFNINNNPLLGIIISTLITSLLFGFAHAANPNATLISSLSICLAGIFLAVGYILTGRLALPIGLHITWNFFQGYVFGFPVSGNSIPTSIINIQQGGPEIITGGAFGPEAGLIGIVFYFVGGGLIFIWLKAKDKKINIVLNIAEYKKNKIEEMTV